MGKVLIIGAGGVGNVVVHKCAQVPEVFDRIYLASRTLEKCRRIAADVQAAYGRKISIARLDADDTDQVVMVIERFKPQIVINVALPYQDLSIMEACLRTGVHYLDTANYEPPDTPRFEYNWQWAYHTKYKKRGIMGLLGCGFDPGVTNVFCAYAQRHLFDQIEYIDIVDCNAGDHGLPFATNFNPEINIREVTQPGRYWEDGKWVKVEPMSVSKEIDFPQIGPRKAYLLYHEELESLVKHIKGLKRIRFWMTFSDQYLTHLKVLQNLGLTRIDPIDFEGTKIVPLKFLKALLPDPGSLGPRYKGKTCIGCIIQGTKDGRSRSLMIYNLCDHQACYRQVKSQAVPYTTGVPAMIGAKLILQGIWQGKGVFNVEQLDPDPFMEDLPIYGLPWQIIEGKRL